MYKGKAPPLPARLAMYCYISSFTVQSSARLTLCALPSRFLWSTCDVNDKKTVEEVCRQLKMPGAQPCRLADAFLRS